MSYYDDLTWVERAMIRLAYWVSGWGRVPR